MPDVTRALFEPIRFGPVQARNRVVMAPMVTDFASEDDQVTDRLLAYYAERARGGVGTIVVEASPVRRDVRISSKQVGSYDDRLLPGLTRLAATIKTERCVALLQLCHGGPKMWPAPGQRTESVSEVPVRHNDVPRVLSVAELRQVRRDFVAAARRALEAGFDGIELHAAHLYLLSASISPFTNTRTDEYGGSTANRARLTREIVEDLRTALGNDFALWVRINGCEGLEPGLSVAEAQEVASRLAGAGADAIHVSGYTLPINPGVKEVRIRVGGGASSRKDTPPGPFLGFAAAIKGAIGVPVICAGKMNDPIFAARAVADGKCDLVALARQLLCDPHWPAKVESGRAEDIVYCSFCLTCHTSQHRGEDVHCSQNLNLAGPPVYASGRRPRS